VAQALVLFDPGPDGVDVGALAESPDASQRQLQRPTTDGGQLGVEIGGPVLGHIAHETQGDVESLLGAPARAWQTVLARQQVGSDLLGNGDGGEQADHHELTKVLRF